MNLINHFIAAEQLAKIKLAAQPANLTLFAQAIAANNKILAEDDSITQQDVIAKLKALDRTTNVSSQDVVTFGLEDDTGGTIKVSVSREDSKNFEQALNDVLANSDSTNPPEIAELLFNLKDTYSILDIVWPEIGEDEEVQPELLPTNAQPDQEPDQASIEPDDETNSSLLSSIIDMMKADADARQAEAKAREAEATLKQATAVTQQGLERVSQEEQLMDMEQYNAANKEADKEAKRLAKLAKWKYDLKQDAQQMQSNSEEEQQLVAKPARKIAIHDVAQFILNRVKQ